MGQKRPSTATVEAVASAEGVEPDELETPLFDVINPEALDSLFESGDGKVIFEYYGYEITVDDESTVELLELAETE